MGSGRKNKKTSVVALVERGGGVGAKVVQNVTSENLSKVLNETTDESARIMTDEFIAYRKATQDLPSHETMN